MIEILDGSILIERVIEKHKKLLDTYGNEFSEIESKMNLLKQQSDAIKKEIESTESKIGVLTEKYHLLFYQAKKQREEAVNALAEKMRQNKSGDLHEVTRLSGRIEELEKRLQNSRHIEDEEKSISEVKRILFDLESAGRKADLIVTFKPVMDKLNDANSTHKELLSLQEKPKQNAESSKEYDRQKTEAEGRHNWLKHRIESHKNALAHWEKQKGGITA